MYPSPSNSTLLVGRVLNSFQFLNFSQPSEERDVLSLATLDYSTGILKRLNLGTENQRKVYS